MSPRISAGIALLVSAIFLADPLWAIDEAKQSDQGVEQSNRQREGGHPIPPSQEQMTEKGATEDGIASSHVEPEFRRDRRLRPGFQLGVHAYNTTTGVIVTWVVPGSPAARVGFEPGDRIVAVSGYQVGVVGHQVYYLGEELQRRADRRGFVQLLCQNVRDNRLLNLDVRLQPRGLDPGRFGDSAEDFPRNDRLGAPTEHERP